MATVNVDVVADVRRMRQGIDQVNSQLSGLERGAGKVSSTLKRAFGVGVALVGVQKIGTALKESVAEAREAQKVNALTANAIRATGGAANVSASQVADLSTAISNKAGVDDEAVQTGANLLLTFKNVRNEAGKGNKVFNQATQAAVDLSAAGFGSIDGASKMLGKALNDPIKGITALGRAGVTFSDDQKKAIAAMTESGDLLGAQKVILGEVKSQVGGAAAASATSGEKLRVVWDNLKERLGTALLPILDKVATFLVERLPGAIDFASGAFDRIKAVVGPVIDAVRGFFSGLGGGGGNGQISATLNAVKTTFSSVFGSIKSIVSSVTSIVRTLWAKFGGDILRYARSSLTNLLAAVRGVFTILRGIFKTIAAVLRGDWKGAWDGIKTILRGAVQVIGAVVRQAFNYLRTVITIALRAALAIVRGVFSGIRSAVSAGASAVADLVRAGFNRAKDGAVAAFNGLLDKVRGLKSAVTGALSSIGSWLVSAGRDLIQGLINGVGAMGRALVAKAASLAKSAINAVKNALGIASPSKVFHQLGVYVGQGLVRGLTASAASVRATAASLAKTISDAFVKGALTKARAQRSLAVVRSYTSALARVATLRAQVAAKLAAAQTRLDALRQARDEYAVNVTNSAREFASITAITAGENQALTANTLIQGMRDRLNAVRNYQAKLATLLRNGLNRTTYDQLVQAGVEGGTATVEALAAGGRSAVSQVNSLQTQINGAAGQLGSSTAGAMYNAGIQATQGMIRGLQSQAARLAQVAAAGAAKMVKAVRKALGIKSPSRVFMGIARQMTAGVTVQTRRDETQLNRSGRRLARAVTTGFDRPQLATGLAGAAGGGGAVFNLYVTAPVGANGYDIGRELAGYLNEYTRLGGRVQVTS